MTYGDQEYIDKANHTNSQLIQLIEKHKMNRDTCDDCVSRTEVLKAISEDLEIEIEGRTGLEKYQNEVVEIIKTLITNQEAKVKALSPVTPTHGTCKDCKRSHELSKGSIICDKLSCIGVEKDFYCADFERKK